MDITIKVRSYELEAIDFLDKKAPEIYKGKKHGVYWATHEAFLWINSDRRIDWKEVAAIRLEDYFTEEGYEERDSSIIHLTLDEEEYVSLSDSMEKQFSLKRPIRKAYCVRNIIKWAVRKSWIEEFSSIKGEEKISRNEDFYTLSVDEKLNAIYEKLIVIEARLNQQ